MSKEVFIALIQKDIKELDVIAQGLYETEMPSPTIIKLASAKAQEISNNLSKLADYKAAEKQSVVALDKEAVQKIVQNEIAALQLQAIKDAPVETQVTKIEAEIISEATAPTEFIAEETAANIAETTIIEEDTIKEPIQNIPAKTADVITEQTIIKEELVEQKTLPSIERKSSIGDQNSAETKISRVTTSPGNSLVNSLANKKVDDIKKAINMGDRFRFQKELFKGKPDLMNETLSEINNLNSLNEALSFLSGFEWDEDNENVADFMSIVSRKFAE